MITSKQRHCESIKDSVGRAIDSPKFSEQLAQQIPVLGMWLYGKVFTGVAKKLAFEYLDMVLADRALYRHGQ